MSNQRTNDDTIKLVILVLAIIVLGPMLMMFAFPLMGMWGGRMMAGFGGFGVSPLLIIAMMIVWLVVLIGEFGPPFLPTERVEVDVDAPFFDGIGLPNTPGIPDLGTTLRVKTVGQCGFEQRPDGPARLAVARLRGLRLV